MRPLRGPDWQALFTFVGDRTGRKAGRQFKITMSYLVNFNKTLLPVTLTLDCQAALNFPYCMNRFLSEISNHMLISIVITTIKIKLNEERQDKINKR